MIWRASATASRDRGTCTAIWSPSKSALNAAQTRGWMRIIQDLVDLRALLLDDLLGPLDRLRDALLHQLVDDERLEQLARHRLRQAALVQPQLRAHHDHRATG